MREIKFRVWDEIHKQFIPKHFYEIIFQLGSDSFGRMLCDWKNYQQEEYLYEPNQRLNQFTGLKDKNGKEIYEGDIVQCKYYYIPIKWWSSVSEISEINRMTNERRNEFIFDKRLIRFNDGAFMWGYKGLNFFDIRNKQLTEKLITGQTHCNDYEEKWWDFEIIGNIYENPELLENE